MSNIILFIWSGLFLAFMADDASDILIGANLLVGGYCFYAFISNSKDRLSAKYLVVEWGIDDFICVVGLALTVSAVWNGKMELPKEASLMGWAIVATALASYAAWAAVKEVGREEKRREWEEKMKSKYKI